MSPEHGRRPFRDYQVRWLYRVIQTTVYWIFRLMFRIRVKGHERVPAQGPLLVVSNHASNLDPCLVAVLIHRPLHFFAKVELFSVPVFGALIRRLGAIPVERGGADRASLEAVAGVLKSEAAVLLFPEGTRTRDGNLQEARAGVGMLTARHADAWILPVYIHGSFDAWPRTRRLPKCRPIQMYIGQPVRSRDLLASPPAAEVSPVGASEPERGKKQLYSAIAREIMNRIDHVKREWIV